jgi:hypothetical protein
MLTGCFEVVQFLTYSKTIFPAISYKNFKILTFRLYRVGLVLKSNGGSK